MSVPLICEHGINTFGRARCNGKQRLQQTRVLQATAKDASSRRFYSKLKEESGLSDRTARTPGLTVRVRGLTTQKHLSV